MPASSGVRSALRPLHGPQALTRFIQVQRPPRDSGTMCSHCRSRSEKRWPQYAHVSRSRRNSLPLLKAGTTSNRLTFDAPCSAMIGCTSITDCWPRATLKPPRSVANGPSPSTHATEPVAT